MTKPISLIRPDAVALVHDILSAELIRCFKKGNRVNPFRLATKFLGADIGLEFGFELLSALRKATDPTKRLDEFVSPGGSNSNFAVRRFIRRPFYLRKITN
jgi:hypothetical protein